MSISRKLSKRQWSIITLIYMGLLMAVSLRPAVDSGTSSLLRETMHNLLHVPAYAALTFFFISTGRAYGVRSRLYLSAFGTAVLYGILIELLQSFSPGRMTSVADVFLNTLGALIIIFIFRRNKGGICAKESS